MLKIYGVESIKNKIYGKKRQNIVGGKSYGKLERQIGETVHSSVNGKIKTPYQRGFHSLKVVWAGVEPATHGFSVHCSTN